MRILLFLLVVFCLPAITNAAELNGVKDCTAIGGQWVNAHAPSRAGSCTLTQAHTVSGNARLQVGPSVDLIIANNGELIVDGQIVVINSAAVIVDGGRLLNNREFHIRNSGMLTMYRGAIGNYGSIRNEGNISLAVRLGQTVSGNLFNYNTIVNFSGGEIHNRGQMLSIGNASIRTEVNASFDNYSGGRYHAGVDEITGRLTNHTGGYVSVGNALMVGNGGVIESSGHLDVGYAKLIGEKGSQISMLSGSGTTTGATHQLRGEIILKGDFSNAGQIGLSGTLTSISTIGEQLNGTNKPVVNTSPGVINIYGSGVLNIQNNVIISNAGAAINNGGTMALTCFSKFHNNGQFTGNAISQLCGIPPVTPPTFPKLF